MSASIGDEVIYTNYSDWGNKNGLHTREVYTVVNLYNNGSISIFTKTGVHVLLDEKQYVLLEEEEEKEDISTSIKENNKIIYI